MSHDGAKLKLIRTATGASKPSYAKRLGVSPRTLARWERGQIPVPEDVIGHMYEHLDLVVDVIDRQRLDGDLVVVSQLHEIPGDLVIRGADVQMWNSCLVYRLLDLEFNTLDGADVRWRAEL